MAWAFANPYTSPSHALFRAPSGAEPSLGAYRILRRVSSAGAYLEVHAGRQVSAERPVFLARFLQAPSSTERLLDTLKTVRGPAMPPLLEVGTAPDGLWLAWDGVEGEGLRAVMTSLARSASFMAPNEGMAVMARVALALEALHRQGWLHGDVCPSTVFLTARGEVQLHATSLAPCLGPQADGGPWRSEPNFLAPEQASGPASSRSDVFRLGLMLYELATGRPLWSGPSSAHLLHAASQWQGLPRERVQQVPEPWQSLLVSMLAVDVTARPTMHEVSVGLENGIRQQGWRAGDLEIAQLLERATPGRTSLFSLEGATPRELTLSPAQGPATTPPTGTPSSSSSIVARITTKKMTREMLAVARTEPGAELVASVSDLPLELRVANVLVERGRVARAQVTAAQELADAVGGSLSRALLTQAVLDEDTLVATTAELTRTPSITARKLAEAAPPPEALALVPRALATATRAVPLGLKGTTQLLVAMLDPMDVKALEQLKAAVGARSLVAFRAGERALQDALARLYPGAEPGPLPANDPLSLVGAPPPRPALAPASELPTRLFDALLSSQGQRGVQAQQLVGLVAGLGRRMQLSPAELTQATDAARTLAASALIMGRLPHDVPRLAEVQDRLGCQTGLEAYFDAVAAEGAKQAMAPPVRAVVVAFTFAAHAGEPRPSSSRAGPALSSFKAKTSYPPGLLELLSAEVSRA